MGRSAFDASIAKRSAVNKAEELGQVSDSLAVRGVLMDRVYAGEITMSQAQDELKKIKREGKKMGLITRSQAFSRG